MPFQFTVSPDFSPRLAPGWFVFNTWLQRALEVPFHVELYPSFETQRQAIRCDLVDLIYANPFDASMILRDKGFRAVAAPLGRADEALIVVPMDHPARKAKELPRGLRIASTDDPDVRTICMILVEPADVTAADIEMKTVDSYVLVAKELLNGRADVGFFLEEAYQQLSGVVSGQLRPIGRSRIHVVRHVLLAGPRLKGLDSLLGEALLAMTDEPRGRSILEGIGITGWEHLEQGDVEFMIDLVDTLIATPA